MADFAPALLPRTKLNYGYSFSMDLFLGNTYCTNGLLFITRWDCLRFGAAGRSKTESKTVDLRLSLCGRKLGALVRSREWGLEGEGCTVAFLECFWTVKQPNNPGIFLYVIRNPLMVRH